MEVRKAVEGEVDLECMIRGCIVDMDHWYGFKNRLIYPYYTLVSILSSVVMLLFLNKQSNFMIEFRLYCDDS